MSRRPFGALGAKLVLVSRYFPEERKLVTRHIEIDSKLLQAATAVLKLDLIGFTTEVDDASLARMLSQRVEVLQDAAEASSGRFRSPCRPS